MKIQSSIVYCDRPRIKAPQIANYDKLPGSRGEDCDLLTSIRGTYFSFHEYSVIY